ncbi:dihydrofolate reductase [Bacillus cereus]
MKKRFLFLVERKFTTSFLPYVDKLYITKIHHAFEGDTFFPEMDMTNWKEIFVEKGLTDEKTRIRIITMYMRSNNNKKD